MVLQNYVILQAGAPARMHFYDHIIEVRTITDALTRQPQNRNVLVMEVDQLNGQPVSSKFSTMSEKLAGQFAAYLPDKTYRNYDFMITQRGKDFQTTYTVTAIPRTSGK
jgi:hypothetical protein